MPPSSEVDPVRVFIASMTQALCKDEEQGLKPPLESGANCGQYWRIAGREGRPVYWQKSIAGSQWPESTPNPG